MIFVDSPVYKKSEKGRKSYAHMVGSSISELQAFAQKIGVKPHFWHKQGNKSHFDITSEQHAVALKEGAVLITSRELILRAREMNEGNTKPVASGPAVVHV